MLLKNLIKLIRLFTNLQVNDCSYCDTEISSSDDNFKLICGHFFHKSCLTDVFHMTNRCIRCNVFTSNPEQISPTITSINQDILTTENIRYLKTLVNILEHEAQNVRLRIDNQQHIHTKTLKRLQKRSRKHTSTTHPPTP